MAVQKSNVLSPENRKVLCPDLDLALERTFTKQGHPNYIPAKERARGIQKWVLERCAADPMYFIFGGFVRTFDPHDDEHPYKPIPDEPHLRAVLEFLHRKTPVQCIPKSRQMMISWLICAYAVWDARFRNARFVMIQSKKAEDAWALVFHNDWLMSRCAFIEAALPPWLWIEYGDEDHPEAPKKYVQATRGKIIYPHGSQITAIPGGAHHFRSHVASLAFIDEACFMPEFAETYKAALAMVKGGGRLRIVSSAKYGSYFGQLIQAEQHMESAA